MAKWSERVSLVFGLTVAISIALAPRVATAALGPEIIINGGFETGSVSPWDSVGPCVARDTGPPAHTGSYTCLQYGANDARMWQNITDAQADLLKPNTTYHVSAWYYLDGDSNPTRPYLKVNLNGTNDILEIEHTSPVYRSWQEIAGVFTTGPGAITIGQIMLRGTWVPEYNGQYRDWDDVSMREYLGVWPYHTWSVDSPGAWDDGNNWDVFEAPDTNTQTAIFGGVITSARTVSTDAAVTVKGVQFDNANTYVIAGAGSVNLEADSGNASLDVDQGDHQFQVVVNLNSGTDADIAAGASLTFNNALNLSGNTLTKTGGGTLTINNRLNTGGGAVVGLGGTIGGDGHVGGDLTNTSATVAPGNSAGTLTVEGNFSQAGGGTLAIELAGTASGEFDVLAVTGTASLNGSLEITELYTPGGGDTWTILTAAGGISGAFSSITAGYQVALANGDTELVLSLSGALLPGDANGDGCVDDLDLTALAVHWQQATNLWEDGDFNGDGIVDDLDLTALAVNWQQGCGGGGGLAAANVPEPTSALILVLGLAGTTFRRARK